jgi:hypothetical protein
MQRVTKLALFCLALPGLAGCADSITGPANTPHKELVRGYEHTLTQEEREAAIADLQAERARKGE